MARAAIALLLLLCLTGCAQTGDGPCVVWAKEYVNQNSMWHTQTGERPNLPAIAIVQIEGYETPAVVIIGPNGEFVDNGYMGGSGVVDPKTILYYLRRRP